MKIKRVFIESFGKLNNYTAEFGDKLNALVEENGFGKTTLAVFIKCMFYGIKGGNKSGLSDENERVKYLTWGSTKLIGGTIDFEVNNTEYRIERYFGNKPSLDTFKLINLKTNKESTNYSQNIGEEIFGIDVNSFERSTYIPQKDLTNTSNNLTTKITSILGGGDNLNSIDNVVENLEDSAKKYYRLNGKSGYIADSKKKISELESKILECKNFEDSANALNTKIAEIDLNINNLTKELSTLKPMLEKAIKSDAVQEEYNKLLNDISNTKQRYNELNNMFENNNTSLEVIDGLITLNKELIKIESKIDSLQSSIDSLNLDKYNDLFLNNPPSLKEVDEHIACASSVPQSTTTQNVPMWILICLAISISVLVVSFVLYSVSFILGLLLTILCVTAIVVLSLLYINSKNNSTNTDNSDLLHITEYLNSYNYNNGNILESLQQLKADTILYTKLLKVKEENSTAILDLNTSKIKILDAIIPYLNKYYNQINDDYGELLESIKSDYKEYCSLSTTLAEYSNRLKEYDLNIDTSLNLEKLRANELALSHAINNLNIEKQNIINNKNMYLEKANLKQDFMQELSIENEILLEHLSKYNILLATASHIKQAKEDMCSKYLEPITTSLLKHLNNITNNKNLKVSVDTELNLHIVENTVTRNIEYYSKGYKDLFDICFRLALIDTLFENEKPFIILDDPFVNLDDKKLKNMMSALNAISNNYQVIYLTCASYRK